VTHKEDDAMTASYTPAFDDRTTPLRPGPGTGDSAPATASALGDDQLLTTAEVALLLRTPNATLRTWRYQGIGPRSFHLGPRGIRYKKSDVLAWLDRQYGAVG
jgi:predicted DNA-binding transcriptional regulator AlpA